MAGKRVVTFGEVLLRLATPRHERFTQARQYEAIYGGTECNVAVALAQYGIDTAWVSAMPDNEMGRAAIDFIRQYRVDTSHVLRQGPRLGVYFIEMGASVRSSKVVYDRANSSFSNIKPGDLDWAGIFDDRDWFHFTGISAAVSSSAAAVCREATAAAKKAGLTVSCDLNYRAALWSSEECQKVMRPMMDNVDVLLGGREDASICLGVSAPNTPGAGGLDYEACEKVISKLRGEFGFSRIGLTLRDGQFADDNDLSASYFDGSASVHGQAITVRGMVDRIGGGDAFSAGVIYGNLAGWDSQKTVNFGVAANAMAHTFHGDFNLASLEEVEALAGGSGAAGRVRR
jgi:2-dehydro-3-deoxygluconokinase